MPLAKIQPSQLYINTSKLAQVLEWWRPLMLDTLSPVPIKHLNGRVIYTDGHTRAFAAYRHGLTRIAVVWDKDPLDWDAYQICVDWCLDLGIRTIMDLEGRVISPDAYERLWLGRCRQMQDALEDQRASTH